MFITLAFWLVLFLYVVTCGLLVVVILSQEGSKGGGLTGGLGTTAGETFGFSSATETFRRFTRILGTTFIILTIVLTYLGNSLVSRNRAALIRADVPTATPSPVATEPTVPTVAPENVTAPSPSPAPVQPAPTAADPTTSPAM
jgi:protein translocase SecG subunit